MNASERWTEHYFACPICQVHEWNPDEDVFCDQGRALREASTQAYWDAKKKEMA